MKTKKRRRVLAVYRIGCNAAQLGDMSGFESVMGLNLQSQLVLLKSVLSEPTSKNLLDTKHPGVVLEEKVNH